MRKLNTTQTKNKVVNEIDHNLQDAKHKKERRGRQKNKNMQTEDGYL